MSSTLDQYKTDMEKQLERKRAAAQQSADINHQKLLKYLPQQTKGYSIGMTETAKIAANNAYQRQLAEADAAYTDGMTQLSNYVRQEQERLDDKKKAEDLRLEEEKKQRQDALFNEAKSIINDGVWNTGDELTNYITGLKNNVSEDQYSILSQYASSIENKAAEQDKLFNEVKGIIEGGAWNTGTELQNYISGLKGKLSDNQYSVLSQYATSIAGNPEQKAAEAAQDKAYNEDGTEKIKTSPKASIGGHLSNIYVGNDFKIGGYKVELGDVVSNEVVPSDATSNVKDKEPFVYNGNLYIKIGDSVYLVRDRDHTYSSDDYKGALALFS